LDIDESRKILEQHNWDIEKAFNENILSQLEPPPKKPKSPPRETNQYPDFFQSPMCGIEQFQNQMKNEYSTGISSSFGLQHNSNNPFQMQNQLINNLLQNSSFMMNSFAMNQFPTQMSQFQMDNQQPMVEDELERIKRISEEEHIKKEMEIARKLRDEQDSEFKKSLLQDKEKELENQKKEELERKKN